MNAVSADKKTATMMVTVSMASLTAGSGQCSAPVWPGCSAGSDVRLTWHKKTPPQGEAS